MPYEFDEPRELTLWRDSVRKFAEGEIAPLARELDEREEFSVALTQKMGDLGLFGMIVDPSYGGQGVDYLTYIVAVEELARVDSSQAATIAAHNSLGAGPIYYFGTEAQKQRFLPSLCTGEGTWGFAQTEPDAGSDVQSCKSRAVFDKEFDTWILNGSKSFITNSNKHSLGVTALFVSGILENGKPEFTSFLIPAGTPGFSSTPIHGKTGWRASDTADLTFVDVHVPPEHVLGERGQGFKVMMKTLDGGRLSIGAMGLGLARGAFEMSLAYANERPTFGGPIIGHQGVSFPLADMAMHIEVARNTLYKGCWLRQNGHSFKLIAAMAKLYCSEVAVYCATEGQKIFGAYGLMKDFPIERFARDVKILPTGEGTSNILRMLIAREICR